MAADQFDRHSMARSYANRHLKTDPAIRTVYYLPSGSPDREIRFIEINEQIADRDEYPLEPIDFGVNVGAGDGHTLMVLDVTPNQWDRIACNELPLPSGWSLEDAETFSR